MDAIVYIGVGFILGAMASAAFLIFISDKFKSTAQDAVQQAHESFLQRAEETFKKHHADGAHDLENRRKAIDDMVKPVQESLKAINSAMQQSEGIQKSLSNDLRSLNRETAKLVGALRDPRAQGAWGEFILEGLLEKSGLIKGVHYKTQVSNTGETGRQRPDAEIHMQDGFKIAIDAKAPLNEFAQRLSEDLSEAELQQLMGGLAKQVRDHVKRLGQKGYWESVEGVDFTVMFVPSEHIYSIALRSDPQLVDYANSVNVIIASPTLLMSLLRVVSMSWRQAELAKNAEEISARGAELYKRLLAFTGHLEKIGKGLQGAMKGYNDAVGSLERSVIPSARKFRELQGQGDSADIEVLPIAEETPRLVSLSAEDESIKKRA